MSHIENAVLDATIRIHSGPVMIIIDLYELLKSKLKVEVLSHAHPVSIENIEQTTIFFHNFSVPPGNRRGRAVRRVTMVTQILS